jgi:selenocysteine lyase/cysteine desulfurase
MGNVSAFAPLLLCARCMKQWDKAPGNKLQNLWRKFEAGTPNVRGEIRSNTTVNYKR